MPASRTFLWLERTALLVLFSVSTGSIALAQPPGAEQNLETIVVPGMTVWITDTAGREEKTRIVGLSGDVVTTTVGEDMRRVRTSDVVRVRVRHSDSVINGALIGAGAGVASGLFLCTLTEPWEFCRGNAESMVRIGALGAGIGIGIDALIRGRRTIYEATQRSTQLHVAPVVGRHAAGLRVSVSF